MVKHCMHDQTPRSRGQKFWYEKKSLVTRNMKVLALTAFQSYEQGNDIKTFVT